MCSIRIATFNCENLFARYKFRKNTDPKAAVKDGWLADKTKFDINDRDAKRITGNAIEETDADVVALQEVEGLDTLRRFRSDHIDGGTRTYPHIALIDGNDPRLIDIAVLSKPGSEPISICANSRVAGLTSSRAIAWKWISKWAVRHSSL